MAKKRSAKTQASPIEPLEQYFTNIAKAIRSKTGTKPYINPLDTKDADGNITKGFTGNILDINGPENLEYDYTANPEASTEDKLRELFSNMANAIRIKRGTDGNILGKDLCKEINNLKLRVPTPSIHIAVDIDTQLDTLDASISMELDGVALDEETPLPDKLQEGDNISLTLICKDPYGALPANLPDGSISGVNSYSWTIIDDYAQKGNLSLTGLNTNVNVKISSALFANVEFQNYNRTVLKSSSVKLGSIAPYLRKMPYRAPDGDIVCYVFQDWAKLVTDAQGSEHISPLGRGPILKDTTYIAMFGEARKEKVKVTWINNGEELETDIDVPIATMPSYDGSIPTYIDDYSDYVYEFEGWSPKPLLLYQDSEYSAQYKEILRIIKDMNSRGGYTYKLRPYKYVTDELSGGLLYNIRSKKIEGEEDWPDIEEEI